jgi:hypothetical protein
LKFEIPGPGQYHSASNSATGFPSRPKTFNQQRGNKQMAVVFDSTEKRFKQKGMQSFYHAGSTAPILGPGSYVNTANSLIKKSFNMSMEHSYFV